MNQKSREAAAKVIKGNCEKCCHNEVCQYKGAFDSIVQQVIHLVQGNEYLLAMNFKCKYHMYRGGTTDEFVNDLAYLKGGAE